VCGCAVVGLKNVVIDEFLPDWGQIFFIRYARWGIGVIGVVRFVCWHVKVVLLCRWGRVMVDVTSMERTA